VYNGNESSTGLLSQLRLDEAQASFGSRKKIESYAGRQPLIAVNRLRISEILVGVLYDRNPDAGPRLF
jgi:hypothetical protein